jgi:hypothetical protein
LQTILSAGNETVELIDQQIADLNEQINQLKKVRKFIAPTTPLKSSQSTFAAADGNSKMGTLIQLVCDALEAGPLHYRTLSEQLEVDVKFLCRAIGRSERLHRDDSGLVSLVEELAAA